VTRAERLAIAAFLLTALAVIGLLVVYWQHPNTQWEGVLLGLGFLAFGTALVLVAHGLLPAGPAIDPRPPFGTDALERQEMGESFDRIDVLSRRKFLIASAGAAVVALAVEALFPLRSLGPRPRGQLAHTPWRRGLRVITADGKPVLSSGVPIGGLVTVFPDGHPNSADGQAVLMRVDPALLKLPPDRSDWAPEGLIVYSKVCTHAGCPVGLFEAERNELLCPCHQSAFNVLDGAKPTSGPAARALPQLPITIRDDGVLVARGDFSDPIGPAYWDRP
jgi:ubiquinol-cytochrome c reductase iron-sulfur subunit